MNINEIGSNLDLAAALRVDAAAGSRVILSREQAIYIAETIESLEELAGVFEGGIEEVRLLASPEEVWTAGDAEVIEDEADIRAEDVFVEVELGSDAPSVIDGEDVVAELRGVDPDGNAT